MFRSLSLGLTGIFVALAMLVFTSPAAYADQRDFTLINSTGQIITHVYVGPSNIVEWGEDILGRSILENGENVFIYFSRFDPSSCLYDVKVLTDSGAEGVLYQINLCEIDTVTFN
ncbi:MAG: hypothetical protein ACKVVP_19960 [Chloroflexota bacterium]